MNIQIDSLLKYTLDNLNLKTIASFWEWGQLPWLLITASTDAAVAPRNLLFSLCFSVLSLRAKRCRNAGGTTWSTLAFHLFPLICKSNIPHTRNMVDHYYFDRWKKYFSQLVRIICCNTQVFLFRFYNHLENPIIIGVSISNTNIRLPSRKTDCRHRMMHPCNVTVRRPIN